MAFVIKDRVREDVSVSGTSGAVTLNGAITGFRTFSSTVSNSDTFYYTIVDQDTDDFEVGVGTYVSGTDTITRGTILSSSNSNNAVDFTGTNQEIFLTHPADKAVVLDTSDNLTLPSDLTVSGDLSVQGTTITIDSASAQTVDLGDNDKIRLGDGDDLQIYHDGNNSLVQDTGAGSLLLRGTNLSLQANNGENYINCTENGEVALRNNNFTKLTTTATGIDVTGTVTADAATLSGTAPVLSYTDTDNSITALIGSGTSDFNIATTTSHNIDIRTNNTRRMVVENDGDISFYEDTGTTPKLFWDASEESLGIGTTSPLVALEVAEAIRSSRPNDPSQSIEIRSNSSSGAFLTASSRESNKKPFYIQNVHNSSGSAAGQLPIIFTTGASSSPNERMRITENGNVGIGTTSPSEKLQVAGNVVPSADATHDLGTASLSWNNIYTNDLHLSNMKHEKGNDVDGTKGDWTIQEGAEDLFIINNRTGKKFKFSLQEVS